MANQTLREKQTPDTRRLVPDGPDSGIDSLAPQRALERIRPFIHGWPNVVFEGERGVGKRHHGLLLHTESSDGVGGAFVEIKPNTSNEVLRAILFDDDRKLLEGKSGKPLPSLAGRSTLYLHNVDEFAFMDQILLSRFLIRQQQSPLLLTRVMISTTVPWSDFLRKLADSFSQGVQKFEVCRIPPLRERFDELPSLVREIIVGFCQRQMVDCWRVSEAMLQQFRTRYWRDNIRELKYKIEEAAANSPGDALVLPDGVADEIDLVWGMSRTVQAGKRLAIDQSLAAVEKAIIVRALLECDFDQRKTSRLLEMTEPNLTYRIKKFNIYIPSSK